MAGLATKKNASPTAKPQKPKKSARHHSLPKQKRFARRKTTKNKKTAPSYPPLRLSLRLRWFQAPLARGEGEPLPVAPPPGRLVPRLDADVAFLGASPGPGRRRNLKSLGARGPGA